MSRILALILALFIGLTPVYANAAEPLAGTHGLPATPEAWLTQMLDARKNGTAFKDPAAFAEWLDAITEPRFMTALAAVAVDPATYPKAMSQAIDPQAARNWSEFTDPQLYLRWMLASADPAFQQAILHKMTDPTKMSRWLATLSRPDAYAAMATAFGRAPGAWMNAPTDPTSYAPVLKAMQPVTPMAWFGAMTESVGKQMDNRGWLKLPDDKLTGTRYRY